MRHCCLLRSVRIETPLAHFKGIESVIRTVGSGRRETSKKNKKCTQQKNVRSRRFSFFRWGLSLGFIISITLSQFTPFFSSGALRVFLPDFARALCPPTPTPFAHPLRPPPSPTPFALPISFFFFARFFLPRSPSFWAQHASSSGLILVTHLEMECASNQQVAIDSMIFVFAKEPI